MKIDKITYAAWDGEATASAHYDTGHIRCFVHRGKWVEDSCPDIFTQARLLDEDQFKERFPGIGLPKWPEPTKAA